MITTYDTFEPLLTILPADHLKRIATLFGGGPKLRKDECIAYLRTALANPETIDAGIARMKPFERTALGILKLVGGRSDLQALGHAVVAAGSVYGGHPVASYYHDSVSDDIEKRVVLDDLGRRDNSYGYGDRPPRIVFADRRVLDRLTRFEIEPFSIPGVDTPNLSVFRRAQAVALDVISLIRAVDEAGGIGLTKASAIKVADVKRLGKRMGWSDRATFEGLEFPDPANAFFPSLAHSGLLNRVDAGLVAAESLEAFGRRPIEQLARDMLAGITRLPDWIEYRPPIHAHNFEHRAWRGRLAIVSAMLCLPDSGAWYEFGGFEQALFARVGRRHSVVGVPTEPHLYGKSPEAARSLTEEWHRSSRENWIKYDVPWLQAAFKTWLFALGIVELSLMNGEVERFRLTDLGRAAIRREPIKQELSPATKPSEAWVVQPNFDVVVYLEAAATEQVAFLERHAERISVAQHSANYRITRNSVYRGLQSDSTAEALINGLTAGSKVPIPSNVVTEIRTWAALRERIVLKRRTELLEFDNAIARDQAIDSGVEGTKVGDRFVLLTRRHQKQRVAGVIPTIVDYGEPPARCLQITENGEISLQDSARADLLTLGLLSPFAERTEDGWQLTRNSVTAAAKGGRTAKELLSLLAARSTAQVPELLALAIAGWSGQRQSVALGGAVLLQCPNRDVFRALRQSKRLKPYLSGRIGDDTVMVRDDSVDAVREALEWAGIDATLKIGPDY